MSAVTKEQRESETAMRAGFEDEVKALEGDEKRKLVDQLSVRDRLMRRLKQTRITTTLSDDLGEFEIQTRLMTGGEREQAFSLNKAMQDNPRSSETYADSIDGMRRLLKELVVTPGVPPEFWDDKEVSDDVVILLMLNTLNGTAKYVTEGISSFRP